MEIYFATTNKNKLREARDLLGFEIKQADLDIQEIQSMDIEEIAKDKVRKAYEIIRKPVIVEDTALYLDGWNSFPGPFVFWVGETMGVEGICKYLGKNRKAEAKVCVAYFDGERVETFTGSVKGEISDSVRGNRFGFDRIFIPEGEKRTFAEMGVDEKNRISHRMKAFRKLKAHLSGKPGFS
jgi:XTP/dITP diphosphohydrolase